MTPMRSRDAAPRDPAPGEVGPDAGDPDAGDPDAVPRRIVLPAGLVGLPGLRRFRVRPLDGSALLELISLDDRSFAAVAAPLPAIAPGHRERLIELGLVGSDEDVLVLLAAHGDPPTVTANLAGPMVVGASGRARQLVVEDPDFPVRAPLGRSWPCSS